VETEGPSAFPVECSSVVQRDGKLGVAKILNTCLVASPDTLKKKLCIHYLQAKLSFCVVKQYLKACGEWSDSTVWAYS
jgi:hypothetical protein